jgi:hypothetical protein
MTRTPFTLGSISGVDGGFVVKGFPAGKHVCIYATSRNRKSVGSMEWDVPEAGGDLPSPIALVDGQASDVDLSAAVGRDVRNARVAITALVGGTSMQYYRPGTVDAEGHLKIGGNLPGLTYRVEELNTGGNGFKTDIELVPKK